MKAYNKFVKNKIPLCASFGVISKYISRSMSMTQDDSTLNGAVFKIFRNSQEGHDAVQKIYDTLKNDVLKQVLIFEKPFDSETVETLLV
jgi:hypothetical protein